MNPSPGGVVFPYIFTTSRLTEHHTAGGMSRYVSRLAELQPDAVLIEGAPELDAVAALAGGDDMVPPVAGLVYAVDEPRRSSFYPLARL